MSKVPTFGVVGRMGLPIVAALTGLALWASGSWALQPGKPAAAADRAVTVIASDHLTAEQVGVTIPSVVFGAADGLSPVLAAGPHRAVLDVWLAAGSPAAHAAVHASGGRLRGCAAVTLRPARVTKVRCTVDADRGQLTLTVATSVAGQHFQTSYAHTVR